MFTHRQWKVMAMVAAVAFACVLQGGCVTGGPVTPEQDRTNKIVRAGGDILLDVAALRSNDATEEERAMLRYHVESALVLVGSDTATGQQLARLLDEFIATGTIDEEGMLITVARVLLHWGENPNPPVVPPPDEQPPRE